MINSYRTKWPHLIQCNTQIHTVHQENFDGFVQGITTLTGQKNFGVETIHLLILFMYYIESNLLPGQVKKLLIIAGEVAPAHVVDKGAPM